MTLIYNSQRTHFRHPHFYRLYFSKILQKISMQNTCFLFVINEEENMTFKENDGIEILTYLRLAYHRPPLI